jgi:hypothetical protein
MKPFAHAALGFVLLICFATVQAGTLGDYPGESDPCLADRQASFTDGYNQGYAVGKQDGYHLGLGDGTAQQLAQCVADPQSCGISLASCMPDPVFGETEPNDNLIAADPLKLGANFWGQSYGAEDQDWFYTETTAANQNLILNFSVPGGLLTGWKVTIRDAAGNIFANFNTAVAGGVSTNAADDAVTYRVTLGLVGTYYIVVQPTPPAECTVIDPSDLKCSQNFSPYSISALLQDSSLDTEQPIVGFADTEIEPNDVPSRANPLATSVSMYGLINLTFNSTIPVPGETDNDPDTAVWGQGDDDWYVYYSKGNEIITLTFCSKEKCGVGDWYVEVYDQPSANAIEQGTPHDQVKPLLAFNTNIYQCYDPSTKELIFCEDEFHPREPVTQRLGLRDPGYYFMRVDHMRLFTAPCAAYNFVDGNGFANSCSCSDGGNSCYISTDACAAGNLSCRTQTETTCIPGVQPGCQEQCETVGEGDAAKETCVYWTTQALCACSQYGGVVALPAFYTSPYNFTWFGTKLPPNTIDTDAYEDFLNRSSPY